jgi:hypothetical protein
MKLLSVVPAHDGVHKLAATFEMDSGRTKTTKFGAAGATDYLKSKEPDRRERYRSRHAKDLQTHDPTRAGFLSWHLLWGSSTLLSQNIRAYKRKFGL